MIDILALILSSIISYPKLLILFISLPILYILYLYKFKYYKIEVKQTLLKVNKNKGNAMPAFPNGWFAIIKSNEIKKGESKYINTHGEGLAVFRANNNNVYILNSFCPHLGANLGVGGQIVHESCIQCPFHGWTFDGETGNCVIGKNLKPKEGICYEYEEQKSENFEFKERKSEQIKIRKFPSIEKGGFIYAYFDNSENYKKTQEIPYDVPDISFITNRLDNRGSATNTFDCHMVEIYANTADQAHLGYIHKKLYPFSIFNHWKDFDFVLGDDPEIETKLKHENPIYEAHRKMLYKNFVNEKNKKHVGFYLLDSTLSFGKATNHQYHLLNATGVQIGGGLSYISVIGNGFEVFWRAYAEPLEKYRCILKQEFYSAKWMPYFLSAYFIFSEQQQVINDAIIWDNKKYAFTPFLNKDNEADSIIKRWFDFYGVYFEGCKKYEENKRKEEW